MAAEETTIRAATLADLDAIITLARRWQAEASTIGQTAGDRRYYRERIDSLCLVALDRHANPVGYLAATPRLSSHAVIPRRASVLEIEELYVLPEHRDRGIGSGLLARARAYAVDAGIRYVHVFTASRELARAVSFYEAHGFTPWSFQAYIDLGSGR